MVLQGLDVLEREGFKLLRGRRVGLITNYSFVTKDMRPGLETLAKAGVSIAKIFTPEHGLFNLPPGLAYEDSVHPKLGIPIISLYGPRRRPLPEDYEGIDVLVYDIQDVGLRYFTFVSTLGYCLETASETGTPFVVLDRVNPLGGKLYGPRMPRELESFVGGFSLPTAYGLTPGELARYIVKLEKLDLDLEIVRLEGWNREPFDDTDLLWNVPSPGLPTFEATLCFAGMCFIEATNLSEGRGTPKPFQYVGAPWLDADGLYEELKGRFPTLMLRKREFMPLYGKHAGVVCFGIEFFPKKSDDFFDIAISTMTFATQRHPEFTVTDYLDRLSGDPRLRRALMDKKRFDIRSWQDSQEEYLEFVGDILLYQGEFI